MPRGTPFESRWVRTEPRRVVPKALLNRIAQTALPHSRVIDVQPLTGGSRNANLRIELDSPRECVVLRIYEHDASICRKEMDLLNLIRGSVPVPEVIQAEPEGWSDLPPFAIFRYVAGVSFGELKRGGEAGAIAQAARSVGRTLAVIHRTMFPKPGWIGPGGQVGAPLLEGPNASPRFVAACLESENCRQRMDSDLRERVLDLVWSHAAELAGVDEEQRLVHGDFGKRNVLVRCVSGEWAVAAVLDWEFAISGSPLVDLGHFLRYERESRPLLEPHCSQGYSEAGGELRSGWGRLSQVVDLIALCESLTHDDLPGDVVGELVELVRAAVEGRDRL